MQGRTPKNSLVTSALPLRSPAPRADAALPSAERISAAAVWIAGLAALLIGGSNLALWWIPDLRFIASWPGAMVMRCNTALAILAASLSLIAWQCGGRRAGLFATFLRMLAQGAGAVAASIGLITTLEYLLPLPFGIDTLFAPATFVGDQASRYVMNPGRMSLNAAVSLLFVGLALSGLEWSFPLSRQRRVFSAPVLAVLAALPACFGLVGYLSGTGSFTGVLKSTNVLIHTATALVLLALGVLAARPQRNPVRRILSNSAGGILLRWLLPGCTASLVLLAWGIGKARVAGIVAPGEGTALMLFGGLILFYTLIVSASRAIDTQEAKTHLATSALREEERRSQSILATSLDGVLIMDEKGCVVDWNQAAERIFGWPRAEMLGRQLADYLIPERLRVSHSAGLQRYLQTGEGVILGKRLELPALRRDGSEFPVELSINVVADVHPPVFVGFIRDITARRRAETALREAKEQAEKASQAKDDFLAALSHELRTPLTPVLLSSSALQEDTRLPGDVRETLAMIERHVTLEARLIDDLLDLTRISRGKLHLRQEPCDLAEILHHTLDIVRAEAQAKAIHVQVAFEAASHRLEGDSARLQQVCWNLLKNAVKFTPVEGTITLRTWQDPEDGSLHFQIQDTGIGFEPSRAEHLFVPFEQEKNGSEHQFGGLGLGLAIARAIVVRHGGEITAASTGPGQGACFTVSLPPPLAESDRPTGAAQSELAALSPDNEGQTSVDILLVEDHEHTRQVLAQLLRRAGHRVIEAGSVESALAALRSQLPPPDLLISDLGLPDGSGLELMQQLRAEGHTLPGIALSGYGMEEDHQRTQDAGFVIHLVKPVKFSQLMQAMAEISKQKQNLLG